MRSHARKAFATTLLVQIAAFSPLSAQTWDGGGGVDTNINSAANWNPDAVPSLNGSLTGTFGTGGSTATMNVDGYFSTLVFNRNSASGFTVNGSGILSVLASGNGATANLSVSDTAGNGVATISAPLRVNTDAGGTRLLVIDNRETGTTGESLVISGGISASNANAYGLRFGGSGSTRITGALTGTLTTNIQQASITGQNMAGTVTIAGNQTLGAAQVNLAGTGSGTVASTAKFVMGASTADVQSWASTTVNQAATVEIKSTATLSGFVALGNATSSGSSGGTLDVSGNLSATTLAIGGSAYSGVLKVSGNASFSGAITSGATAGSKIVGGGVSTGTLSLASGTVGSAVAIGGAGTNENNIALVKTTTSTLTVSSANNTYSGGTTLVDGGGSSSFGIALGANNALGSGPLAIGTAATGTNGARLRMAGFNQTASALSSGAAANLAVIENFSATNSTLTVNGSASSTYGGFLRDRSTASLTATGNLGLVKNGAGTLTLSNASNQYTGATIINGGVLEVAGLANGGLEKTVTFVNGSSTATVDTTGISTTMPVLAPSLATGFHTVTALGANNVTLSGNNTNILSGTNTAYFGGASSIGVSSNAASNLVFGGGTLRYTGGNTTTDRNFTVNSGQSAKWDVANGATTLILSGGAAASTGGFQKLGAGIVVLTGAQAYTGDTLVTAGVLALGAADRISDSSRLVLAGGTFDVNGFSETLGALDLDSASFLDLDNASNATGSISFATSAAQDWGAFGLSIAATSLTPTSVRFGTSGLGLTVGQLANITVNGQAGWTLDSAGYLTAIPEPSAFAAFAGLLTCGAVAIRRRRRA